MANYRSVATVTLQNRKAAYEKVAMFMRHLDPLDVNLLSLVYNQATQRIDIVTQGTIPAGQFDHLGIEAV